MKPFLSVIIPCYNEKENLERGVLEEVSSWLEENHPQALLGKEGRNWYEVIIADDESSDNSRELVKQFVKNHKRFKHFEFEHGGKAVAQKNGLEKAKGEYVLFTDMDQSTPIKELEKLFKEVENGHEVVIGSRGKARENFSLLRLVASNAFRLFRKSLLLRQIDDTQCGFKLAKTEVAKKLFSTMKIFEQTGGAKGWVVAAWDVEFLFLAEKFGFQIAEVSVDWSDKDASTGKDRNLSKFVKESLDMLKQVTRVRVNDWNGSYEANNEKK